MDKILHTKYGNAKSYKGYYRITSSKEGNCGKWLHRLIFEDYHKCKLNANDIIHHIDFESTNNHITNLICMSKKAHRILHNTNRTLTEETKNKISESMTDRKLSEEHKNKISKAQNTSGYLNVSKNKCESCKQGFIWRYLYYEDGKQKSIVSVDLKRLEAKVKAKGLKWKKFEDGE